MLIVKRTVVGQPARPYVTEACGLKLSFDWLSFEGEQVLASVVEDTHPQAPHLAHVYRNVPGYDVVHGVAPVAAPPPVQLAPAPQLATGFHDHLAVVVASAHRNGWSVADLTGTGLLGDAGPVGGTSPRSGLTLAQMALCTSPDGWEARAAQFYPWECDGWRPPGLDWATPIVPAKREPDVAPVAAPVAEPAVAESEADEEPVADDEPESDEGEPLSAYDRQVAEGAKAAAAKVAVVDNEDPAVRDGYPQASVVGARRLAHTLATELHGAALHFNKFNWAIRKHNTATGDTLATATGEQLAGLLALPPT